MHKVKQTNEFDISKYNEWQRQKDEEKFKSASASREMFKESRTWKFNDPNRLVSDNIHEKWNQGHPTSHGVTRMKVLEVAWVKNSNDWI